MALIDVVKVYVDKGDVEGLKTVLERGLAVAEGTDEYPNAGTGAQDFCNVLTSPRQHAVATFLLETRAALASMDVEPGQVDFGMGVLREFIEGVSSRISAVREKVERVKTGFAKNDYVFLTSDPSKVFTIVDFSSWETVGSQAQTVQVPTAILSEVTEGGGILTGKTVALSELEKLPSTGDWVFGDYDCYPDSITDKWKMLGVFALRKSPNQPVTDRILIGSVPDDFGGLSVEQISALLEGKGRILPVEDYVDIKRDIRDHLDGRYHDFFSPKEFAKFQRDMKLTRDKELAALRKKLAAIQ